MAGNANTFFPGGAPIPAVPSPGDRVTLGDYGIQRKARYIASGLSSFATANSGTLHYLVPSGAPDTSVIEELDLNLLINLGGTALTAAKSSKLIQLLTVRDQNSSVVLQCDGPSMTMCSWMSVLSSLLDIGHAGNPIAVDSQVTAVATPIASRWPFLWQLPNNGPLDVQVDFFSSTAQYVVTGASVNNSQFGFDASYAQGQGGNVFAGSLGNRSSVLLKQCEFWAFMVPNVEISTVIQSLTAGGRPFTVQQIKQLEMLAGGYLQGAAAGVTQTNFPYKLPTDPVTGNPSFIVYGTSETPIDVDLELASAQAVIAVGYSSVNQGNAILGSAV